MCALECPSRVNIPKLVLEAKSTYRQRHRASVVEVVLGRAEVVARLGSSTAPLTNLMLGLGPPGCSPRWLWASTGVGPWLPSLATRCASREQAARPVSCSRWRQNVAYFADLFAEYYEPDLALAVIAVLEAHGVRVSLLGQRTSGIPEMLYGYSGKAREVAAGERARRAAACRAEAPTWSVPSRPPPSPSRSTIPTTSPPHECAAVAAASMDSG